MDCITPHITWKSLLDVAVCESLPPESRAFAVDELQRLAEYLDDSLYYGLTELHARPFALGKPAQPSDWQSGWRSVRRAET